MIFAAFKLVGGGGEIASTAAGTGFCTGSKSGTSSLPTSATGLSDIKHPHFFLESHFGVLQAAVVDVTETLF